MENLELIKILDNAVGFSRLHGPNDLALDVKDAQQLIRDAYIAGLDAAKGVVPGEKELLRYKDVANIGVYGFNDCRKQTLDAIELEKGKI